jgi:hypothetical protein
MMRTLGAAMMMAATVSAVPVSYTTPMHDAAITGPCVTHNQLVWCECRTREGVDSPERGYRERGRAPCTLRTD